MKRNTFFLLVAAICCGPVIYAQNPIDYYATSPNTYTEIANETHGLSAPHDLDYVPGRPDEWWVLNKETNGGSMVLLFNAGMPAQTHQFRRDSHNEHFMARAVAMAFGDHDYFVTAQEIKNTASPSSTFMGPALWSSDTSIFARMHQNDWLPGELLGSHIDMLHQSPFGMGVAFDNGTTYWYFDGFNGNICKYDFAVPHGVGEDDHSDGRIHRYTDVKVTREPNIPSHLALDKSGNRLFIVDGGTKRVLLMHTATGSIAGDLDVVATGAEPLAEYKEVTGATQEVMVSSGLSSPCGIDYARDRIIVSDYATGNIHIYDVSVSPARSVGTIITGGPGVMGVRIDNRNRIWYVNRTTKKLYRIDNPNVLSLPDNALVSGVDFHIYPNPASDRVYIDIARSGNTGIRVFDLTGRLIQESEAVSGRTTLDVSGWAKGIYQVVLSAEGKTATARFSVQ